MPLVEAERIGRSMVNALLPLCERVELAGSIRRRKPFVGDIEIVCIPRVVPVLDMFGAVAGEESRLEGVDWSLYGALKMNGKKQKKIILREGVQLDLFITTAEQWGYIFMLRTGPDTFSHKMVTPRKYGGYLPSYLRCDDGYVWSKNRMIPLLEESDLFSLCGLGYVPPEMRK
jgi:DNA polymerase/3'-5' exonuclease PolX